MCGSVARWTRYWKGILGRLTWDVGGKEEAELCNVKIEADAAEEKSSAASER